MFAFNTYRCAIGIADSDLCNSEPDTTQHIFSCPVAPTDLTVEDLWCRPVEVARFISALPAFKSLPPLEVQEPRLPPKPPPGT